MLYFIRQYIIIGGIKQVASCKTWSYPQNETVKQFEKLFPEHITIDTWYPIGNGLTFIYENSKFYYHMTTVKKNQLGYYVEDYTLGKNGELKYNKEYGYFKTKDLLIKFLEQNQAVV
jgi:hypothetical protein